MGFWGWGLGFGVWGLGFGVWGLGFGVWGSRLRVERSGIRVKNKKIFFCKIFPAAADALSLADDIWDKNVDPERGRGGVLSPPGPQRPAASSAFLHSGTVPGLYIIEYSLAYEEKMARAMTVMLAAFRFEVLKFGGSCRT